jgi:microcystin degradation protein MlrC
MKVLIATMSHETNTFSPVPTELERFSGGRERPPMGEDALRIAKRGRSTMSGLIEVAEEAGLEIVTPILAGAPPSGPVSVACYEFMSNAIVDAIDDSFDGVMLSLHGAMVTERHEDGEGTLLERIRSRFPDMPIAVGLDMHANLYDAMVENATVVAGYHTYPHIDAFETGARAGRVLLSALRGETRPTMAWGNAPMLPHVMRQGTDDFPNQALQARAREMECEDALVASLFTGFPHADIANAGLSAVVVTDDDLPLAERLRDELLQSAWENREAFVYRIEPLEDSLARARAIAEGREESDGENPDGPVVLLDHYDNTASGGTMDTTEVLREILRQGLEDVAVFGIHDPAAVQEMISAGVGARVSLEIGGKLAMPSLSAQSSPLAVTGTVRLISDGQFTITGPMDTGNRMGMGLSVVLDTGAVQVVVLSRHAEPYDLGCFASLGIDPWRKRFLMLKSRIHYRAAFKPVARAVVECAGCGVCTSDFGQLRFEKVRRPIHPLDEIDSSTFRPL